MEWWNNLKHGLNNLWVWFPIIWNDCDWDWAFLAIIMRFKMRRMADHIEQHSYHLRKDRDVRELRVCAELLRRMRDQPYYDNADARFRNRNFHWAQHVQMQENQDDALLGKMIAKHMRGWWC